MQCPPTCKNKLKLILASAPGLFPVAAGPASPCNPATTSATPSRGSSKPMRRRKEQNANEAKDGLPLSGHPRFRRALCRVCSLGRRAWRDPNEAFHAATLCQSHQRLFRFGRAGLRDRAFSVCRRRVGPHPHPQSLARAGVHLVGGGVFGPAVVSLFARTTTGKSQRRFPAPLAMTFTRLLPTTC